MRLFVALDIPETIRQRAHELCTHLKIFCPDARWVRPESMHLTLKFIGEVQEAEVETIRTALAPARLAGPLELHFQGVSLFPYRHPHTIVVDVVDVAPYTQISELAQKIEWYLKPLGIPPEKRHFSPHLTVARIQPRYKNSQLREHLVNLHKADIGAMRAEEFYLYRSTLKRGGAEYTKLATFRFTEGAK